MHATGFPPDPLDHESVSFVEAKRSFSQVNFVRQFLKGRLGPPCVSPRRNARFEKKQTFRVGFTAKPSMKCQ